jgi:AcrR family transcriptional regulator
MSEHGSAGTSMRRLAAASEVNVATIYHYFPSKSDLLAAVIGERHYGERLITEEPDINLSQPVDVRFSGLVNWLWFGTYAEQSVLRLIVAEAQRSARGLIDALDDRLVNRVAELFPELKQRGVDPAAVARLVRRQLVSLVVEFLITGVADPEAGIAELSSVLFGSHPPVTTGQGSRSGTAFPVETSKGTDT